MSTVFTLKYGAIERTLADWGIEQPQLMFISRAADTLTFRLTAPFDGVPTFAFGSTLELYSTAEGVRRRVFVGRVTMIPTAATSTDESHSYTARGLTWYLDNKVYQEFWASAGAYKSRVQLSYGDDGEKMSGRETIAKVLNYVIDAGAPFAVGDITAITGYIPSEEVGDRTCGEVIELVLRWYPDAVLWWDYAATPPTINISTAATAPQVDFAEAEELRFTRRDDLRVPGVAIKYEWINNVDGESFEVVTTDSAGDADAFGAMVVTVSLRGGSSSTMRQKIKTEVIDLDQKTWWRNHVPQLKDVADEDLTIVDIIRDERTDADGEPAYLPRLLKEGSHTDWMPGETGNVKIVGRLKWVTTVDTDRVERTADFTVSGTGTSLSSRTYTKSTSSATAEPLPTGVAARIFAALNREHWEGTFDVVEQECSHWGLVGKAVRLVIDGQVVFGPAQVQSTVVDLHNGKTTVNFGPAPILSAGDLVELLRATRNRRDSSGSIKMSSGGGVGIVDGSKTSANDAAAAMTGLSHTVVVGPSSNPPRVEFNFQSMPNIPIGVNNVNVQLRKVQSGCVGEDGKAEHMFILASEPFMEQL